jgi:hypothetical protein
LPGFVGAAAGAGAGAATSGFAASAFTGSGFAPGRTMVGRFFSTTTAFERP